MTYIKWFSFVLLWLTATAIGPLVYIVFPKNEHEYRNNFIDSIWGNAVDGLQGDKPYRNNEAKQWFRAHWPSFWWSCVRNPANNLARYKLSAHGRIKEISRKGNLTTITTNKGKFFFYYTPDNFIMIKSGWKFFADTTKVGEFYAAKLAFSLQRGRGKAPTVRSVLKAFGL